jgi:hypothetical protein
LRVIDRSAECLEVAGVSDGNVVGDRPIHDFVVAF